MKKLRKTSQLASIQSAEESLKQDLHQPLRDIAKKLPPDNSVRIAYDQLMLQVDDISALPNNHPLIIALQEAQKEFEPPEDTEGNQRDEESQSKVRHAKRIDKKESRRKESDERDEWENKIKKSVEIHNSSVLEAITSIESLRKNLHAEEDDFKDNRYGSMKIDRLLRSLNMIERVLGDGKMNEMRVISDHD